ncbi:MAG: hypothetical protein ABIG28_03075 [archaeon]
MRRWAFVIFIIGMFVLLLFLGKSGERVENLEGLVENSKVIVSGEVVSERVIYEGTKLFVLDSGIELVCSCLGSFVGEEVEVEGVVEGYEGKKQVRVLEILW